MSNNEVKMLNELANLIKRPERLLELDEVLERLKMPYSTFQLHKAKLIARGLQRIKLGRRVHYRETSLDRMIRDAAEGGYDLC